MNIAERGLAHGAKPVRAPLTNAVTGWRGRRYGNAVLAVTIMAVIYNALLAAAGANGFPVNYAAVAVTEAVVLCCAALLLVGRGTTHDDVPVLIFAYFFVIVGIAVSLLNERIFVDAMRGAAIIVLFTMLGLRIDARTVRRTFLVITTLVLLGLLLEIVSTQTYVSIFEPALYYERTRGLEQFSLDDSGLFRNALGFEGRMQATRLLDHRASSIFIEQVSLANYLGILTVFLLAMWRSLGWRSRLLHVGTAVLILLANSTRAGIAIACVSVLGYFVYPLLPRYLNAAVAPALLAVAAFMAYVSPEAYGDDVTGRLALTIRALGAMDIPALTGQRIEDASGYLDSGYAWVIVTSTGLGLLAFWAFVSFFPAQRTKDERRAAWALAVYLFANMLVGGTAIFSAKVAPPLWLLIGNLRREARDEAQPEGTRRDEPPARSRC